jgi:hypothetical protein
VIKPSIISICMVLASLAVVIPQETLTEKTFVQSPSVVKRDRPIRINHPEGVKIQAIFAKVDQGAVAWSYLPEDHFERSGLFTIFVAPPGDYFLTTGESTIIKIVDGGSPAPEPPKPQPKPEPDSNLKPKLKVHWAVWVYEQADSINQVPQTNTRLSSETRRYLESRGIKMSAYDDDQDSAKAKPFIDAAGKLPSLFLIQDSLKYSVYKAPSSLDELKAIVKEATGE